MTLRFNPPPNWPKAPDGWRPPDGWVPPPEWPPPPYGWPLWVDDAPPRKGLLSKLRGRRGSTPPSLPAPSWEAMRRAVDRTPGSESQKPSSSSVVSAQPLPPMVEDVPAGDQRHPRPDVTPGAEPMETSPQVSPGGSRQERSRTKPPLTGASQAKHPTVFELWGQRGWCHVEVVGESHYEKALRRVVGTLKQGESREVTTDAVLSAQPSNPHDRNAVLVHVDGHHVGHLAREDAARYTDVLQSMTKAGLIAQVGARIWASVYQDYSYDGRGNLVERPQFRASVRLDLAEPHLVMPGNLPPAGGHVLLPQGGAIQVTGEDKHVTSLSPYAGPEGEQYVYATLHELVEQLARSTRTVVEVRIDDQRIGQLTPKMSGEVLPAVRHLAGHGMQAATRALVKGNRVAAEAVLYVKRAHEIEDEWYDAASQK